VLVLVKVLHSVEGAASLEPCDLLLVHRMVQGELICASVWVGESTDQVLQHGHTRSVHCRHSCPSWDQQTKK